MAVRWSAEIEGVAELLARLDGVKKKVRQKALRKALGAAAKVILWAAKARVVKVTGLLRKSLGRKVKVYRRTGVGVAIVGPRTGFKREASRDGRPVLSNPTKYAHLVEAGTSRSRAKPFLVPALRQSQRPALAAMGEVIAEAVLTP